MVSKFWLIVILSGLVACRSSNQSMLNQDQQRLVLAYVDLLFLQQTLSPANPAYADSCQSILETYKISESYTEIMHSLNRQPEQWEAFYQAVLNEIDRRTDKSDKKQIE